VYAIMSRFGLSNAKIIWKNSKVGRQDIYRVLLELQKIGIVEKVIAKPSQYRAIPMAEAVSMLFQQKKNEVTKLQAEAVKLIETQCPNAQEIIQDKYEYIMIPKEILDLRVSQAFKRIQISLSVSSTFKILSEALLMPRYAEAIKRGIQVRVIVNTENKNYLNLKQSFSTKPNFKIRYIAHPATASFVIFDEREIYMSTNTEAIFLGADALWSNYPSIVNLLLDYFETLWNVAKENGNRAHACS
jgi:sugar-specific transcriptional regulator TrmB